MVLLGLAGWVTYNAIRSFDDSSELEGGLILLAGGVGLVVNVIGLLLLRHGVPESISVCGAYPEVLGTRSVLWRCGSRRRHPVDELVLHRRRRGTSQGHTSST